MIVTAHGLDGEKGSWRVRAFASSHAKVRKCLVSCAFTAKCRRSLALIISFPLLRVCLLLRFRLKVKVYMRESALSFFYYYITRGRVVNVDRIEWRVIYYI